MKIKYLGTAASEGFPALFCECENCRRARLLGGRNIRTRSQALIDEKLLIDFPCDSYYHMLKYDIDLAEIRDCLITHVHSDHFYPADIWALQRGYSNPGEKYKGFNLYGSRDVGDALKALPALPKERFAFHELAPFERVKIGDFFVTPLPADHGTPNPYIYAIEREDAALLYAHDTGIFGDDVWDYLRSSGMRFALVSLDCTGVNLQNTSNRSHLALDGVRTVRAKLQKLGAADDTTVFVLNHFSHNAPGSVHDDLAKLARRERFSVAYDGLEILFCI